MVEGLLYLLKVKRDDFGGLDLAGSDGEGSRGNEMDTSGMSFLPFIGRGRRGSDVHMIIQQFLAAFINGADELFNWHQTNYDADVLQWLYNSIEGAKGEDG